MSRYSDLQKSMRQLRMIGVNPAEFDEITIKQTSTNKGFGSGYNTVITYKCRTNVMVTTVCPNGDVDFRSLDPRKNEEKNND